MSKVITPEMLAKSGSEEGEQKALFAWANFHSNQKLYPELQYLFAVPNGGLRHKAVAANLRAAGVKKGVPDIWLPVKRGIWSGLVIEMKKPAQDGKKAGALKIEQSDWIEFLKEQGYATFVSRKGWQEAQRVICQYLDWERLRRPIASNIMNDVERN